MIKVCTAYSLNELPLGTKGRVIALGLFDGIHQGHLDIIRKTEAIAERDGLTSTVQTFKNLIKNGNRALYTHEERAKLIGSEGVDEILMLDFDSVKDMEPEAFLTEVLYNRAIADTLVMGEDYRFGRNASGDVNLIKEFAKEHDIRVIVVKEHLIEGSDEKISTTVMRRALEEGNVDLVRDLCGGRNYSYSGYCAHGKQLGRTLGFPTANLIVPDEKFVVRRGVYVSRISLGKRVLYGVTNIGRRPTVEDAENDVAETFIFDFDEDIYGARIELELLHFLRAEEHYGSKDELTAAVEQNKLQAAEYLKSRNLNAK